MKFEDMLEQYNKGNISIHELKNHISFSYIENIGNNISKFDLNRGIRKGIPEVVYAERKTYSDLIKIISSVLKKNETLVVSRIAKNYIPKIRTFFKKTNYYFEIGKNSSSILVSKKSSFKYYANSKIGIISAGTSDIGIAEEARLISKAMGCKSVTSYDVGIAGIHRLFPTLERMISENVHAMVVVAGMEGALASIVSSCVNIPVIGVPTSVGYGFGSNGIAALSSMLQSCVLGMTVVNIDNGLGAGAFAALISNRMSDIIKKP